MTGFSVEIKNKHLLTAFSLSFLIWIACFWGFISGKLAFTSDAVSYYNHFKYLIENLAKGVYPLWDHYWHYGSPNEFFLRRLGSFNPFILLPVVLVKLGVPFIAGYMVFIVGYFFLGCIGFYKLAQCIFNNRLVSFVAFLLLLFSSLGTRIFDSFIVLEFVPLVWFFYFLCAFFKDRQRLSLAGVLLSAMLLLTTYIPFYFLNIVIVFFLCFSAVYPKKFIDCLKIFWGFVLKNKVFTGLCVFALVLALLPAMRLFQATSKGEVALSRRHAESKIEHVISVGKKTITEWGIEEDLFYSYSFRDLKKFKFALFYVPVIFYLLGGLGLLVKLNKRLVFLFVWVMAILIAFSPYAPVYNFLYEHVFYFKYFRNLHFYLWWAALPGIILFSGELLRLFLEWQAADKIQNTMLYGFIIGIHAAGLWAAAVFHHGAVTTYAVICLSCLFFLIVHAHQFSLLRKIKESRPFQKGCIYIFLLLVVPQPVQLYRILSGNSPEKRSPYVYDTFPKEFAYTRSDLKKYIDSKENQTPGGKEGSFHYAVNNYEQLARRADNNLLKRYLYHKFILTEDVVPADYGKGAFGERELNLMLNGDASYVSKEGLLKSQYDAWRQRKKTDAAKIFVEEGSEQFKVADFNANALRIETNFKDDKFLIYNDNYHSAWSAYINGAKTDLLRANYSFKGLWIPAGKQEVYLMFGYSTDYALNIILLCLFYFIFFYLIFGLIFGKRKLAHAF